MPLTPGSPANSVWALGTLSPGSQPPAYRLVQHGSDANSYGAVTSFTLTSCPTNCTALTGAAAAPPAPPAAAGVKGPLPLLGGGGALYWTLDATAVTLTFRASQPCGWAALGIGSGMVGGFAYLAWEQPGGAGLRVDSYSMGGLSASAVSKVGPQPGMAANASKDASGVLTLSVTRPLAGGAGAPSIDPSGVPLIYALGNSWGDPPNDGQIHFAQSSVSTAVNLKTGEAHAGAATAVPKTLIAHGVLMACCYAAFMPLTAYMSRYAKRGLFRRGSAWFDAHRAVAYLSLATAAAGVACSLALQKQSKGSVKLFSTHSQLGVAALALLLAQPLLALPRPKPGARFRAAWAASHRVGALAAFAVGVAAMFTGIALSRTGYGVQISGQLQRSLIVWLAGIGGYVALREVDSGATALRVLLAKPEAANGDLPSTSNGDLPSDATVPPADVTPPARRERGWAVLLAVWVAIVALFAVLLAAGEIAPSTSDSAVSLTGPSPPAAPPASPPPAPVLVSLNLSSSQTAAASAIAARFPRCTGLQPFELLRLGDGWCDAGAPYNTADCGFDGGDCCRLDSAIYDCLDPAWPNANRSSVKGLAGLASAPTNPRYSNPGANRQLSTQQLVGSFNNMYEFTTSKDVLPRITPAATSFLSLNNSGWTVTVDGAVANPLTLHVVDFISLFALEERVYRHRCVETWAIVVPWIGFPLRKLLSIVQPLPSAQFIRFETALNATAMPGQSAPFGSVPWPYVEGITVREAWNDLMFISVGAFRAPLLPQNGAPIRLTLPHKYGLKSIKSLVKISFVNQQPVGWWQQIAPAEYGFWGVVNPAFPHPRWSQATETALVTSPSGNRVPTIAYNGYGNETAHLYGTTRDYFY